MSVVNLFEGTSIESTFSETLVEFASVFSLVAKVVPLSTSKLFVCWAEATSVFSLDPTLIAVEFTFLVSSLLVGLSSLVFTACWLSVFSFEVTLFALSTEDDCIVLLTLALSSLTSILSFLFFKELLASIVIEGAFSSTLELGVLLAVVALFSISFELSKTVFSDFSLPVSSLFSWAVVTWLASVVSACTVWPPYTVKANPIKTEAAPTLNLRIEKRCFSSLLFSSIILIFFLETMIIIPYFLINKKT